MSRIHIVILAAVFITACGSGASVPQDLGDACADIGEVYCERADSCGLLDSSATACVNEFFFYCCAETGECGDPIQQPSSADWDRCLSDVERSACSDIVNGDFPVSCLQL